MNLLIPEKRKTATLTEFPNKRKSFSFINTVWHHTTQQIHTMKKQSIRLLLACTIALVLSGCASAHHSGACDYKVIYGNHGMPDLRLDSQIQKAAADGWKVVSSGGGDEKPFVILSRPK